MSRSKPGTGCCERTCLDLLEYIVHDCLSRERFSSNLRLWISVKALRLFQSIRKVILPCDRLLVATIEKRLVLQKAAEYAISDLRHSAFSSHSMVRCCDTCTRTGYDGYLWDVELGSSSRPRLREHPLQDSSLKGIDILLFLSTATQQHASSITAAQ